MKKALLLILSLVLILTMAVGCSNSDETNADANKPADTQSEDTKTETAKEEPKYGGTVTYAYTQPFKGILSRAFYEGEDDDYLLNFMHEGLLNTGDDLKTYPYIADWTESDDHKTFTFKIKEGIKWHNGDELTVEDWKYALEIIAHPDYEGSRYSNVEMVVGADEFHKGEADSISGIKIIDPYTIEISVKEPQVNTLDNLWSYPEPKKYLEGIAVKDLVNDPKVRQTPIGIGPFKVKKIQPGEFVEFERFDDYWQGKPYLDGVIYKVVDGELTTSLLENGEIDIVQGLNSQYEELKKLDNVVIAEEPALSYSYLGFDFGHWDKDKEEVVMDNPKYQNKKLRQAMAYALDRQGLIDAFSNGLGTVIDTPMATVSWAIAPESELVQYDYNQEKAKQLLDEAGYKDVDGDGFREDPDGKKFTIGLLAMSGSDISEPRAQAFLQMWKEVGLNAELTGGSLKEFNLFYDLVMNDDPSVDVFMGAWGLASDPDPSGLWRKNDYWNFPRWTTEESERLIKEGIGEKAFDENYRKDVYVQWQKIVNEELPMIYLWSPVDLNVYNKRLHNVHTNSFSNQVDTHLWWVSE